MNEFWSSYKIISSDGTEASFLIFWLYISACLSLSSFPTLFTCLICTWQIWQANLMWSNRISLRSLTFNKASSLTRIFISSEHVYCRLQLLWASLLQQASADKPYLEHEAFRSCKWGCKNCVKFWSESLFYILAFLYQDICFWYALLDLLQDSVKWGWQNTCLLVPSFQAF